MPTTEAHVPTSRADRYLAQLTEHLGQLGQHSQHAQHSQHGRSGGHDSHGGGHQGGGPPTVRHVEQTDHHARIEFDWGRLTLTTTPTELVLNVHADDADDLARAQRLIGHRVETIGRRDQLTVAWLPADPT